MRQAYLRLCTGLASYAVTSALVTGPAGAQAREEALPEASSAPQTTPAQESLAPAPSSNTNTTPPNGRLPIGLTTRKEHFPLWAELTGAGLGLAGVVAGVTLLQYKGKIATPEEPDKTSGYVNQYHGTAILVAGAQLLALSVIFLAIDRWPRQSYTGPRLSRKRRVRGLALRF